jgi:hypothetical protein
MNPGIQDMPASFGVSLHITVVGFQENVLKTIKSLIYQNIKTEACSMVTAREASASIEEVMTVEKGIYRYSDRLLLERWDS